MDLIPEEYILNPEAFESVFFRKQEYTQLRNMALNGDLDSIGNRFITWKIFLGILPEQKSLEEWKNITQQLRERYQKIKQEFAHPTVENDDPLINNPLSQASSNPWNKVYEDQELKSTIMLDVERTYQDRELFQQSYIKELMANVLFVWSKKNPELSYKQGLNEILAILLFVAYGESVTETPSIEPRAANYLKEFNDRRFLEADLYWMFTNILERGQKDLFNPVVGRAPPKSKKEELFEWNQDDKNELVGKDKSKEQGVSAVLSRCHRIHHRYLQSVDKELYGHLEREEIEPQMHLLRWIRCILNREFLLADAIHLWDAIFSCASIEVENKNVEFTGRLDPSREFILLDFLCVAMLVFVRGHLLESDNTGCLMRLLKFPPVEDVQELVRMAVKYRDYIFSGNLAKPSLTPTPAAPSQPQAPAEPQPSADPLSNTSSRSTRAPVLIRDTKTLTTNEIAAPKTATSGINSMGEVINMLNEQLSTGRVNIKDVSDALAYIKKQQPGSSAPAASTKALQSVVANPLMRPL